MVNISDFLAIPKIDAHNHLNLGMRYKSYVPWAGFYIPDFPRPMHGLPEMHEVIGQFTRNRCVTAKDVQDLITLSIQDAVADGVTILEGSIDIQFVQHCNDSIDEFLSLVQSLVSKFKGSIEFRPELGLGKTFPKDKIDAWAPTCIESGLFKSIDLYGPEVEDGIEEFKYLYELSGKKGLKRKAHVGEFSDAASIKKFIEYFELDEVQHGIGAVHDDKVIQFLKDRQIKLNITPTSNVMLGAVPSMKEHPIKKLYDAGIPVSICTDDLLFFNKSVSEECVALVEAGTLTKEEVLDILNKSIEYVKSRY